MAITYPSLNRNGKVLQSVLDKITMGKGSKGWEYIKPQVEICKKGEDGEIELDIPATYKFVMETVLPWLGEEVTIQIVDRYLTLQGQAATENVKVDPDANPVEGNLKDGWLKVFTDSLEKLSMRGGETKEALEGRLEVLQTELMKLVDEATKPEVAMNAGLRGQIFAKMTKKNEEIRNVKAAIELRSRTRKTKEEVASVKETAPAANGGATTTTTATK